MRTRYASIPIFFSRPLHASPVPIPTVINIVKFNFAIPETAMPPVTRAADASQNVTNEIST